MRKVLPEQSYFGTASESKQCLTPLVRHLSPAKQSHYLTHRPYGVTIVISNACTLSLVQFDGPPGNELVLESYWELRGDILPKGRGRRAVNTIQWALESVA